MACVHSDTFYFDLLIMHDEMMIKSNFRCTKMLDSILFGKINIDVVSGCETDFIALFRFECVEESYKDEVR